MRAWTCGWVSVGWVGGREPVFLAGVLRACASAALPYVATHGLCVLQVVPVEVAAWETCSTCWEAAAAAVSVLAVLSARRAPPTEACPRCPPVL